MSARTRVKKNSVKKTANGSAEAVPTKRVSWTSPDVAAVLRKVSSGALTSEKAAASLGTKPYYVEVRSGWLKQFGSAAEPEDRGAAGSGSAGKKKKRTATKSGKK